MNKIIILLTMIFLHIVDDYYLQGVLAKMKQKSWWEENVPDSLYKHDYIVALVCHAFSWTFMIMLPITYMIYNGYFKNVTHILYFYCFALIANISIHMVVDDGKANAKDINLIQDQLIHLVQIIVTWFAFVMVML